MSDRNRNGWVQPKKIVITAEGRIFLNCLGHDNNLTRTRGAFTPVLVRPAADSPTKVDLFVPAEHYRNLSWNAAQPTIAELRSGYMIPVRALWASDEHGQLSLRSAPCASPDGSATVPAQNRPQCLADLVNGEKDFTHYLTTRELLIGPGGQLMVRNYRVDSHLSQRPEDRPQPTPHPVRLDFTLAAGRPTVTLTLSFETLAEVPIGSDGDAAIEPQRIATTV